MKKSVLVIDDDAMFRKLMCHHLNQMGFEVIELGSAHQVTQVVDANAPVACLIDMIMEDKEGIETIQMLCAMPRPPKLFAISGNPMYLSFAEEFDIAGTLLKPISTETLRKTFESNGISAE